MIFNSFTYLAFLALTVCLYWWLPRRPRLVMLFIGSIVFYGFWRFDFALLLLASVAMDYFLAIVIENRRSPAGRKAAMLASVSMNLGLLGFFKYYYFLSSNAAGLATMLGLPVELPVLKILLPIGISFYTFQSMSYTIDVYRGLLPACREFFLFANYVIYFPQLIAGPILRASEVIWQLDMRPAFNIVDISAGLQRIIGGLALKVVLADNIAGFVDEGFSGNLQAMYAFDVMTLAFLFGFQIYFDFAAYSHIAIGSARLMGIHFPENFNHPYIATSPREFWRRWHISLSSWIRDYLYLPLASTAVEDRSTGGLAVATRTSIGGARTMLALFLTWAIMGLWHGAAWAFVLWGLWHASLIALYRATTAYTSGLSARLQSIAGWFWTLPMMMIGWIPFRTQSIPDTLTMWGHLVDPWRWFHLGLRESYYLVAAIVMVVILGAPLAGETVAGLAKRRAFLARGLEVAGLTMLIALVLIYLRPINQFIYFQF